MTSVLVGASPSGPQCRRLDRTPPLAQACAHPSRDAAARTASACVPPRSAPSLTLCDRRPRLPLRWPQVWPRRPLDHEREARARVRELPAAPAERGGGGGGDGGDGGGLHMFAGGSRASGPSALARVCSRLTRTGSSRPPHVVCRRHAGRGNRRRCHRGRRRRRCGGHRERRHDGAAALRGCGRRRRRDTVRRRPRTRRRRYRSARGAAARRTTTSPPTTPRAPLRSPASGLWRSIWQLARSATARLPF